MTIQERTRPKGFNRKVWEACYKRAERTKAWALRTVGDRQWCTNASTASLEMLGEALHLKPWQLAEQYYKYLEMRAHGSTGYGALDPSARRQWEAIVGRKIGPSRQWRYDHTRHITSASRRGSAWVDFHGRKIKSA